MRRVLKSFI